MNNGKDGQNESEKTPSPDPSRSEESSRSGSIFGRNLELKLTPDSRAKPPATEPGPPMENGDRMVYFKVEAGKVVDILSEEFQGMDSSRSSPVLVEDLFASWNTLWSGDDHFPVKDFTEMFEVACTSLSSARNLERKLTPHQRETLSTLLQAMSRLASGEEGQDFLIRCRAAKSNCSRMNEVLARQTEPAGGASEKNLEQEKTEDISNSVDEWFTQVSSLVVESGREEGEPAAPQQGSQTQELQIDQQQIEEPATPEIEKTSSVSEEMVTEEFEEVAPLPEEKDAEKLEATEEKREPWQEAVEEELDLFPERPEQPAAAAEKEMPAKEAESPAASAVFEEEIAQQQQQAAQQEIFQETPEIVGLYFTQQCRDTIELVNYNLSRLSVSSARRTSRMLARYLGQIVRLAEDFDYRTFDQAFVEMRKFLIELASVGKEDDVLLMQAVEGLQSVMAEIEREL